MRSYGIEIEGSTAKRGYGRIAVSHKLSPCGSWAGAAVNSDRLVCSFGSAVTLSLESPFCQAKSPALCKEWGIHITSVALSYIIPYILGLIGKVISVSLETVKIVKALPELGVGEEGSSSGKQKGAG